MFEFEERMEQAYAARTRQDLTPLLADLPDLRRDTRPDGLDGLDGPDGPDGAQIRGFMSSHQRARRWEVPRRLRTRLVMSSASLDFTEADLPSEVEIDLALFMTSVELIVPPGVRVETHRVREFLSSTSNRTHGPGPGGGAVISVRGRSVMSSVTVRHANALTQWWRGVTGGR